uniref:Helitron helicase-like domain-containing protein n=1 Tax=Brassica oleracea TaxID=3712 RepID=A0A3P6ET06_BRAOL|nr:unnamed protein product [Brassica oleracea]
MDPNLCETIKVMVNKTRKRDLDPGASEPRSNNERSLGAYRGTACDRVNMGVSSTGTHNELTVLTDEIGYVLSRFITLPLYTLHQVIKWQSNRVYPDVHEWLFSHQNGLNRLQLIGLSVANTQPMKKRRVGRPMIISASPTPASKKTARLTASASASGTKGHKPCDKWDIVSCPSCRALLWNAEATGVQTNRDAKQFSLCCQRGRVRLPPVREPPSPLLELLESPKFRPHMRVGNSLLAFTSMGHKSIIALLELLDLLRFGFMARSFIELVLCYLTMVTIPSICSSIFSTLIIRAKTERSLLQKYIVDAYVAVETERLRFISLNQKKLRADLYNNVCDAVETGDVDATQIGKKIILPSSFTAGPRYMSEKYQDAMAICRWYGNPHLFITVTANPNWVELSNHLDAYGGDSANSRPDLECRIFKIKLDKMMADFKKGKFFPKLDTAVYTIEFQKRGPPHAHILLWLKGIKKEVTASMIDEYISAEFSDRKVDKEGFELVERHMIHGPCGKM